MSDRTFEDGWRAACESLAATYTDVARDSIALERRENFSNAAAAARFRANEPDTPAPSDAARTQAIEHAARRVLSVFEVARSPHGTPWCRGPIPEGALKELGALMVAVESPAPTPPPMETAAVEELLREAVEHMESMLRCSSNCGDPDAECPMQDAHKDSDMAGIVRRSKAALTRLRATTTATNQPKET